MCKSCSIVSGFWVVFGFIVFIQFLIFYSSNLKEFGFEDKQKPFLQGKKG